MYRDAEEEESRKKKVRGESVAGSAEEDGAARETSVTPLPQVKDAETEAVTEVTKGVNEVELEDKEHAAPESIPLPEEESGELDEPAHPSTQKVDIDTQPELGVVPAEEPTLTEEASHVESVSSEANERISFPAKGGGDASGSVVREEQTSETVDAPTVPVISPRKLRAQTKTEIATKG